MLRLHSRGLISVEVVRLFVAGAALVLGACERTSFDCGLSCPPDARLQEAAEQTGIDAHDAEAACETEQRDACGEGRVHCRCIQPGQELADVFTLVTDGATVLGPGESARIDVRLDANAFIRTETHFQLEGLPQPLVGSFNPDAVTAQLPSTVLTVTAPPGTPPGTYGSIEVSAFLLGEKVARRSLTFSVVERDFSLDVSPGAVDFTTSGTVYLSLSATPSNGFQGTVLLALGELPDDVRIVQPLTSSSLIVIAGGSTVSSLGLGFAPTPPVPTSASFVLTATSPDGPSHSRTVTVNYPSVTTPGFTLAADRTELVLTPGGTDTATVTVGGAPAPVQLAASGLPAGVIATFDPAEVTGTGTSLLTVQASAQAIPGPPATFYLYGSTASGLSQSVPLTISIIPR